MTIRLTALLAPCLFLAACGEDQTAQAPQQPAAPAPPAQTSQAPVTAPATPTTPAQPAAPATTGTTAPTGTAGTTTTTTTTAPVISTPPAGAATATASAPAATGATASPGIDRLLGRSYTAQGMSLELRRDNSFVMRQDGRDRQVEGQFTLANGVVTFASPQGDTGAASFPIRCRIETRDAGAFRLLDADGGCGVLRDLNFTPASG